MSSGDSVTVEQAIYALVVISANDVAVAVAEHIGGSEAKFAQMMTRRARELGMKRTTFRNASGLPDDSQRTTARDMAILSRALMKNHPTYYAYFQVTSFTWNGKTTRTHNRVLLSLNGANGIKTGYTKLSGYNLTTSAERNGKRLIGVVLGGDSWQTRDSEMKNMLEAWFAQLERRPNLVASYGNGGAVAAAPAPVAVAAAAPAPKAREEAPRVVAMAPIPDEPDTAEDDSKPAAAPKPVALALAAPPKKPEAVKPAKAKAAPREVAEGDTDVEAPVKLRKSGNDTVMPLNAIVGKNKDQIASLISSSGTASGDDVVADTTGGFGVQIGAFDTPAAAKVALKNARSSAGGALKGADDMVMEVTNDAGKTLYRARFTGLSNSSAQNACSALKADSFGCVTFSTATASN
jgi:D-alanyl-D-alanine carboxypeptidase